MNSLILSLRMLRRSWRSGEVQILFWALLIAVAGMTAVEAFTQRVQLALERQANDLLGADLVVHSDHPLANELPSLASKLGLQCDFKTEFPSVATANEQLQLGAIKAVGTDYPLRGRLRIAEQVGGKVIEVSEGPHPGETWLGQRMIAQLNVDIGDEITLGSSRFKVTAVVQQEPDQSSGFAALAPRVIIHHDDLAATKLLQRGSRARYTLLLAGSPQQLNAFRDQAESLLTPGQRIEDVKQARPQVAIALDRADRFLALAAMVSVVLAGVAIISASRRYLVRHLDEVAVLRCMGASDNTLFIIVAGQPIVAGLLAAILGVLIGYGIQFFLTATLASFVASELPLPGLSAGVVAFFSGVLLLLSFSLPSLLKLRKIPALRVLRNDIGNVEASGLGVYLIGMATVILLMLWQAQDLRLVAYVVLGVAVAVLLLYLVARGAIYLLRYVPLKNGYGWRLGLRAMTQRPADTAMQLTACGIGLMVLLLFGLIRTDLLDQWQASLPEDAPNQFLINVQPGQLEQIFALFDQHGLPRPDLNPAVRGRLVSVNNDNARVENIDIDNDTNAQSGPARSLNLSFSKNEIAHSPVVAGEWWSEGDKASVSLEQDFAKRIGAKIGDSIRVNVAGIELEAKVVNLRQVEWDSFKINFYMVFSPDVMKDQPTTYISAYKLDEGKNALTRALVTQLPNVSVIDVGSLVEQVQTIISRVTKAVEYVFMFTVLAGCVVLFAAIHSTLEQRVRHSALMRALGASRRQLSQANFAEFAGLGLLAGIIAATVATVVASIIASIVFDLTIVFNPAVWLWGVVAGVVLVCLVGFSTTRHVLQQPPWQVLRALD
ncbi:MAG: ABC transporter permease [Gammaproteobacteria bacterium]|nr:MAG: ABC transporter permease [Gammaproteobacteria bacterium]